MAARLDTLSALRALAAGQFIPPAKYAALRRAALIRVRGHGKGSNPALTDAGHAALVDSPPPGGGRHVRA